MTRVSRSVWVLFGVAAVALPGATAAHGAVGELRQKSGTAGCISDAGSGSCADGNALERPLSVAVSPDGKNVYAASSINDGASFPSAVTVFDRAADGGLGQKAGAAGCVAEAAAAGCATANGLDGADNVVVSPDGKNVYTASFNHDVVAVLDRAADGTLSQKAGPAGCVNETGSGGCADGRAMISITGLAVSPDGKHVYVTSLWNDAVAVFDRAADGTLVQKAGALGCVAEAGAGGCTAGRVLDEPSGVAVSPDGKSVYVTARQGNGVAVFDRAADGTLAQKAAAAGCIHDTGASGCADGLSLDSPAAATVSADGENVYVTTGIDNDFGTAATLVAFNRATDGTLTQQAAPAGCVESFDVTACGEGRGLYGADQIVASAGAESVYTTAFRVDTVAVFDRDDVGSPVQKAGAAGCVALDNAEGCAVGVAFDVPESLALSPDGRSLYVAASANDAITVFDREVPVPPPVVQPPPPPPPVVDPPRLPPPRPAGRPVEVLAVRRVGSAPAAGGPLVLQADVRGDIARYDWDVDGNGRTDVSCSSSQPALRFRAPGGAAGRARAAQSRSLTVRLTAVPQVAAAATSTLSQRIPLPSPPQRLPTQIEALPRVIARAPAVMACGSATHMTRDIKDLARWLDRPCLPGEDMTIHAGPLEINGCRFNPITTVDQIPPAERGILEEAFREFRDKRGLPSSLTLDDALQKRIADPMLAAADAYITKKRVGINGLSLGPSDGAAVIVFPQIARVGGSNVDFAIPGGGQSIGLDAPRDLLLKTTIENGEIALGRFNRGAGALTKLGRFPLAGDVDIKLTRPNGPTAPAEALIHAKLKLPEWLKLGGVSAEGDVRMRALNPGGLVLDGFRIGPVNGLTVGPLRAEELQLSYARAGDEWRGQGKVCVPGGGCLEMLPPTGGVVISRGELDFIGAELIFNPVLPLWGGVDLRSLGFSLGLDPTRIAGRVGLNVARFVRINGNVLLAFPSPAAPYVFDETFAGKAFPRHFYGRVHTRPTVAIGATASVALPMVGETELGAAYVLYEHPGYVAFGGRLGVRILVIELTGRVEGELNTGKERFNVAGHVDVCVADFICGGASAAVSNRGVGGCVDLAFTTIGGGVLFNPTRVKLWPIAKCRWGAFTEDNVHGRAARAAQASGLHVVTIKRGDRSRAIQLDGVDGAPRVRVTGPGFTPVTSPDGAGTAVTRQVVILRSEQLKTTSVGLQDPKPGTYRIELLAGSPRTRRITEAVDPLPAQVRATVGLAPGGDDAVRVLRYDIRARPAQRVTFLEHSRGSGSREIGTVSGGGVGTLRFTPAPGRDTRTVEAIFSLDGLPAERVDVARFAPPSPFLDAPRRLRAVRRGRNVGVSWSPVVGAAQYEVVATLRSGRQRVLRPRRPAATLRGLPAYERGRISVRAVATLRESRPAFVALRGRGRAPNRAGRLPRPRRSR